MKKFLLLFVFALIFKSSIALCEIKTEVVEYKEGGTILEGYLAYDDAQTGKHPGIVVVHEWKGLNDYAKMRAEKLAKLGYVAFAADIYGKGVRATTNEHAGKLASIYKNDRELMRARAKAALDTLSQNEHVDPSKLAAIGYCFGGTTVLEMARAGFPVLGVVSFHGGLSTPLPAEPGKIHSKILTLHGMMDPFVSPAEVAAFQDEMKKAGANVRFIAYEGAVHGFTNPDNGDDPTKGMAYNEKADQESWEEMKKFFSEVFK